MRPFSTKLKVKLPKIWASLGEVSLGKSQHVSTHTLAKTGHSRLLCL